MPRSFCHKTVILLDRRKMFLESSECPMDIDTISKSRAIGGLIPIAPLCKSQWTCNVEAAVEYCRIVADIYPQEALVI